MTTSPKPHPLFKFWTPDKVAECMDGVGDLYSVLWSLAPKTRPYNDERLNAIGTGSLAESWGKLTDEQAEALNRAAAAYLELSCFE